MSVRSLFKRISNEDWLLTGCRLMGLECIELHLYGYSRTAMLRLNVHNHDVSSESLGYVQVLNYEKENDSLIFNRDLIDFRDLRLLNFNVYREGALSPTPENVCFCDIFEIKKHIKTNNHLILPYQSILSRLYTFFLSNQDYCIDYYRGSNTYNIVEVFNNYKSIGAVTANDILFLFEKQYVVSEYSL